MNTLIHFIRIKGRLKKYAAFLPLLVIPFILYGTGSTTSLGPVIFYSDLISGPNSGGQNNNGAFVTIYGKGFGATQGSSTVMVGCEPVASYPVWSDTKITFQLGSQAKTGDIIVHIPGEALSNGVPFAIRNGNIYFVSTGGSDGHDGSFSSPWAKLQHAADTMKPGDISYAEDGVTMTACQQYDDSLDLDNSGAPNEPLAIVAYPGATVKVGSLTCERGIFTPGIAQGVTPAPFSHWVIAGLKIQGQLDAVDIEAGYSIDYRFVGNDMTAPNADGDVACFTASGEQVGDIKFLGNTVHDCGVKRASKLYHGVYFSTDSNHDEIGWNTIYNINGCRGLLVHSSPLGPGTGYEQYDIVIHDNVIHDTVCDGIGLATVDAARGPVEVFNNVVYNAGMGPDPPDGLSDYACLMVANGVNTGSLEGGVIQVFNNTFSNCGYRDVVNQQNRGDAGALTILMQPSGGNNKVMMTNNIIAQKSGEPYLSSDSTSGASALLSGSNNLWFGAGAPPSETSNNLIPDPQFLNLAGYNFQILPSSPAVNAGVLVDVKSISSAIDPNLAAQTARDINGVPRSIGSALDVGAYEAARTRQPSKPDPPGNLKATVQ